jgi:hypothetical protein
MGWVKAIQPNFYVISQKSIKENLLFSEIAKNRGLKPPKKDVK